ncbi:MAG TPA: hypothetical protein VN253_09405 [Kofleriaceae bacterium]|nr:hypothetical protein [Kofleriaceae bacterium]
MSRPPFLRHLRRALVAPGNLLAGSGALALSAITWNPLPLILYGLGEPVWLGSAAAKRRYVGDLAAEDRTAATRSLEQQLASLVEETPCGGWILAGKLPDYPRTYARLVELRAQIAQLVAVRDSAAKPLEEDIVARLDAMLRAYLTLARERLLFHCALAKVYPQLDVPAPPATLAGRIARALRGGPRRKIVRPIEDVRFISLEQAMAEVRAKADGFRADLRQRPEHEEVYRPIIETLDKRVEELAARGRNDRDMAAQLRVFPDQFELISSKLATAPALAGEIVGEMKLLLEQTDDTVKFAEDMRSGLTALALDAA